MKKNILITCVFTSILLTPFSFAQSDYFNKDSFILLKFSAGFHEPDTDSDIFSFNEEQLTLSSDDFDSVSSEFKIYRQLNNRITIGAGLIGYDHTEGSQYREYVFEEGGGIFQDTTLENNWIGVEALFTPFGAGNQFGSKGWAPRQFVPFFTIGAGFSDWTFLQEGNFVDEGTLDVFYNEFEDSGTTFMYTYGAGLRFNLSKRWDLEIGVSQAKAEDTMGDSFEGFGDIDLGWKRASIGITLRL